MRRLMTWRVVGRLGWMMAKWALRVAWTARGAKRHRRGLMGRAARWDRSISRGVALAVLPVPRWVAEVAVEAAAHGGGLWLWGMVSGALFWRWASKAARVFLRLKRGFRRYRPWVLRCFDGRDYGRRGEGKRFPSAPQGGWGMRSSGLWQRPRTLLPVLLRRLA